MKFSFYTLAKVSLDFVKYKGKGVGKLIRRASAGILHASFIQVSKLNGVPPETYQGPDLHLNKS